MGANVKIKTRRVQTLIASILKGERREGEVSVLFTDDAFISRLNRRYRKKSGPTDVLAFPSDPPLLGDVVISTETAARQAKSLGHSLDEELSFLVIHGTLHLLGYDHHKPNERKIMFAKQRKYHTIASQTASRLAGLRANKW